MRRTAGGGTKQQSTDKRSKQHKNCQVHDLDLVLSAGADGGRNKTPTQQSATDSNRISYERFIVASGIEIKGNKSTINQTASIELI